jgi:5'-deoxynucleotidase YfbR-like HD superfamily hydrolase
MRLLGNFEERLSVVPRWTIVRTIQKQSVAEHSFRVALIAGRLVRHFFSPAFYNEARNRVFHYALLHDQAEAFTGDIPTPAGRRINKKDLEDQFVSHYVDWVEPSETIEQVVKVADYVEALIFLTVEKSLGNNSVDEVIKNVTSNLHNLLIRIEKPELITIILDELGYYEMQQDPLS